MTSDKLKEILNNNLFTVESDKIGEYTVDIPLFYGEGGYSVFIKSEDDGYYSVFDGGSTISSVSMYNNISDKDFKELVNYYVVKCNFELQDRVLIKKVKQEELQQAVLNLIQLITLIYSFNSSYYK